MFAGVDLSRAHVFATHLHAARSLPAGARRVVSVQRRVRSRLGACIDKGAGLVLEEWRSEGVAARGVFESRVEVRRAVALVSAASVRYDDGAVHSLAPWASDDVDALVVRLPYRTTGTLRLRCEAAPFAGGGAAFRLHLRCDKWSAEVVVPRALLG
jgi:hypothetical protein